MCLLQTKLAINKVIIKPINIRIIAVRLTAMNCNGKKQAAIDAKIRMAGIFTI